MVEINTRLQADPAPQVAFGRSACAEQSVVQQMLDACTDENVIQMQQVLDQICREHSRGYRHAYHRSYQLLNSFYSDYPPLLASLPSRPPLVLLVGINESFLLCMDICTLQDWVSIQ